MWFFDKGEKNAFLSSTATARVASASVVRVSGDRSLGRSALRLSSREHTQHFAQSWRISRLVFLSIFLIRRLAHESTRRSFSSSLISSSRAVVAGTWFQRHHLWSIPDQIPSYAAHAPVPSPSSTSSALSGPAALQCSASRAPADLPHVNRSTIGKWSLDSVDQSTSSMDQSNCVGPGHL